MKSRFLNKLKPRLIVIFGILCAAFIIHSCKKDSASNKEQPAAANPVVNLAKQWYDAAYPTVSNSKLSTQSTGSTIQDWSKTFSPYWAKANTFMIDSLTFIELPALKRGNMAMSLKPRTDPSQFNFSKSGSLTSLIIVNKSGTFYIYAMTILADSSYLKGNYGKVSNNTYRHRDKDFSGMVFYNRLDGSFVNGWQYTNGEITGVVTQMPITQNSTATSNSKQSGIAGNSTARAINYGNKTQPDVAESCTTTITTTYWEDCSYYVDDVNDEYPFNCYIYTTQSSSTSCVPNPPPTGGSAPPPPCTPASPPEASVVGVHEISDVAAPPPTGGGIVDQTNQIGTTPCPSNPPPKPPIDTSKTPCAQAIALANSAGFKALMTALNGDTGLNYEDAYTFDIDANGNVTSTAFQGLPNSSSVQLTFAGGPVDGYAHDHYAGDFPTFSGADIQQIYNMMQTGKMKNPATFTASVVTASGTSYIIKISDPGQFATFGAANLVAGSQQFTDFLNFYGNNVQKYELLQNNQVTSYELGLLAALQDSGLTVLKGNSNFTSWGTITNASNKLTLTNCNNTN